MGAFGAAGAAGFAGAAAGLGGMLTGPPAAGAGFAGGSLPPPGGGTLVSSAIRDYALQDCSGAASETPHSVTGIEILSIQPRGIGNGPEENLDIATAISKALPHAQEEGYRR